MDNENKGTEIPSGPEDGSLYFQLEKDDNTESEFGASGSQDYDLLDSSAKPGDRSLNRDDGAYQHIQPQTTPTGNDQDYQHLKRDEFR